MKIFKQFFLFFIASSAIYAQDTIPACVWGVSSGGSGNQMHTEYTETDSVFITAWDSFGVIWAPRAFSGLYSTSNDTVWFTDNQTVCGSDTGIYTFRFDTTCARDRIIFTLVSDPCAGRVQWHNSFGTSQYPCYEWTNPIENKCWAIFDKFTGAYTVKEFSSNNEVYETGYDHVGAIISPRQQNGWYYNNYDTVTFVAPPGSTCGSDSGVYELNFFNCTELRFQEINDPCIDRVSSIIGNYDIFNCKSRPDIGLEEELIGWNYLIYPNPAIQSICIENLKNQFDKDTKVVLFDLLGNELLARMPGRVGNIYTINVGHLSAGVYIMQVLQSHEVTITERIVIQK